MKVIYFITLLLVILDLRQTHLSCFLNGKLSTFGELGRTYISEHRTCYRCGCFFPCCFSFLSQLILVLQRNLDCQLFSTCSCHCLMTSSSRTLAKNSHRLSLAYMLCSVNNVQSVETYINNFESRPSQRLLVSVTRWKNFKICGCNMLERQFTRSCRWYTYFTIGQ